MTWIKKKGRLIHVPADAVIHEPQVFLGFIRFKGCVGGIISQKGKTKRKSWKEFETIISRV